jgi:ERCC4-type nuclease
MKRITVIMPNDVYEKIIKLTKKEKRSKSAMAAILIEDGLKLIVKEDNAITGEELIKTYRRIQEIKKRNLIEDGLKLIK